ncbi:cyclohexanone monooxygenase [Ilyonectria sp. MPI-CAGE-AT-0026]|nr:cyclohexanone monooxygenase [Ilyonectria sp. MPI-CAGE-AT-0026]
MPGNVGDDFFSERPVDTHRPIKVIVIGAGFSGIAAGVMMPRNIPNLELTIYDKNPELGGTWYENRYPGLACDVPAHAFQYTFENNSQWSSYYAPGPEFLDYLRGVSKKYGVNKYMKLDHLVKQARWNDCYAKWEVELVNTKTGENFWDTCDVLCPAVGIFNKWKWPDIEGLHDFRGKLMHSADYDTTYDLTNKNVALIGAGASGLQILPKIQPVAKQVFHYVRSRTWVLPGGIGQGVLASQGGNRKSKYLTKPEDLQRFRENPDEYRKYRHHVEHTLHRPLTFLKEGSLESKSMMEMTSKYMEKMLPNKPEAFKALVPAFPVGCRRPTPGPGYLEALNQENVLFFPGKIQRFYPSGVETANGEKHEVDAIICATGFDGLYRQHFPVYGKDGVNLQDLFNNGPQAYLSICPAKMPNYFIFLGPNGGPGIGSAIGFMESQVKFTIKAIRKIQREWLKSMVIKSSLISDFRNYADRYFKPLVFANQCNTWWKFPPYAPDGKLIAIWPGSQLHGNYILDDPRWEDFEYEMREELAGNPLSWFGNGFIGAQFTGKRTTDYLDAAEFAVTDPSSTRGVVSKAML